MLNLLSPSSLHDGGRRAQYCTMKGPFPTPESHRSHTHTQYVSHCSVDVWSNRMEGEAHDSSVGSRIACLWRYTAYSITSRGAIGKLI